MRAWALVVIGGSAFAGGFDCAAQQTLLLGESRAASTMSGAPAEFVLDSDGPGFLTVVVRGSTPEGDLVLSVADDDYQTLADARSDQDLGSNPGAEQIVAQIPRAGRYRVVVDSPYDDGIVAFQMGASFLSSDLASLPPDPDGRPTQAVALEVGATHEDRIDSAAGDGWDWYSFTAPGVGVLTVLTRGVDDDEGDLKLEAFQEGSWREPVDTSDQDEGGLLTNESLTFDVTAGEIVYVRVSPFGGGGRVTYRIASGLIPG
jgi:hypothetical protein